VQALWVTSAEDVVLRKLRWFDDGDQVSDRQWRDILAVLRTQAGRLDDAYLDSTARGTDAPSQPPRRGVPVLPPELNGG
jgi:hypothetical protein